MNARYLLNTHLSYLTVPIKALVHIATLLFWLSFSFFPNSALSVVPSSTDDVQLTLPLAGCSFPFLLLLPQNANCIDS
ncbi:hypothetical protein BKA60DRAFT_573620 [Fusarium oxysporum]|nr:hypothetical protein BKA60DRAFT_573620 [Fusarium oxysporum]